MSFQFFCRVPMLITNIMLFVQNRIIRKLKSVFKKDKGASKKTDAAVEPSVPPPPTYDALMEARENDEANVSMPKNDIRDDGVGIMEDVTDMEEYLSVVEEASTQEEKNSQDEGDDDDIMTHPNPAEMKVVEEPPAPVSSSRFFCGLTNCLGKD